MKKVIVIEKADFPYNFKDWLEEDEFVWDNIQMFYDDKSTINDTDFYEEACSIINKIWDAFNYDSPEDDLSLKDLTKYLQDYLGKYSEEQCKKLLDLYNIYSNDLQSKTIKWYEWTYDSFDGEDLNLAVDVLNIIYPNSNYILDGAIGYSQGDGTDDIYGSNIVDKKTANYILSALLDKGDYIYIHELEIPDGAVFDKDDAEYLVKNYSIDDYGIGFFTHDDLWDWEKESKKDLLKHLDYSSKDIDEENILVWENY